MGSKCKVTYQWCFVNWEPQSRPQPTAIIMLGPPTKRPHNFENPQSRTPYVSLHNLYTPCNPLSTGPQVLDLGTQQFETSPTPSRKPPIHIWVVVKMMVPFWIPIIIRHLKFRHPKGDHTLDNHSYAARCSSLMTWVRRSDQVIRCSPLFYAVKGLRPYAFFRIPLRFKGSRDVPLRLYPSRVSRNMSQTYAPM